MGKNGKKNSLRCKMNIILKVQSEKLEKYVAKKCKSGWVSKKLKNQNRDDRTEKIEQNQKTEPKKSNRTI